MKKVILIAIIAICQLQSTAQIIIRRPPPVMMPINNYTKKIGNSTFSITKKTADQLRNLRPTDNKVLSATNEEVTNKTICRTEVRRYTAENMDQNILNPDAISNLRLGGVYSLEKMQTGNYVTINTNRLPTKIYLTAAADNGIIVNNPDENSLQEALDKVSKIPYPVTPSTYGSYLQTSQVTSEESLNIAANMSYSGFGFDAATQFGYTKGSTSNKFLLTYINPTYTAFATPQNQSMFFNDPTLNKDNSYVYISQITYGVKLFVYFEDNVNYDEINGKMKASGWGVTASFEADVKNRLQNTDFKIYLYGSNEPLFVPVKGYTNMVEKVDQLLQNISIKNQTYPIQMGKPISYQLRFLDGDIAVTSCKVEDIPQRICGPNPNMALDLKINLEDYIHGGYGIDGNIKAALRIGENEFWNSILYTVPSQARIGSRNVKGVVSTITIPTVSKDARDNGVLRLYGIWNANGDKYLSGVNLSTGPFLQNIFYKDIPLKDILATEPGKYYNTTLEFRGSNHVLVGSNTETFFIPTITAHFVY